LYEGEHAASNFPAFLPETWLSFPTARRIWAPPSSLSGTESEGVIEVDVAAGAVVALNLLLAADPPYESADLGPMEFSITGATFLGATGQISTCVLVAAGAGYLRISDDGRFETDWRPRFEWAPARFQPELPRGG
jgi:hypothetical protein